MTTSPTRSFTLAFAIITLIEMLSDTLSVRWLYYGSKPLIMALLFLYTWQHRRQTGSSVSVRWLLTGMIFALLGDVFLMIQEMDLFALGLGSFLVMQLCYSRAFWLSIRQAGHQISLRSVGKIAIPFLIYDALFLFVLYPRFSANPALTPLWWPVVCYVFCLSTMGLLATQITQPGQFRLANFLMNGSVVVGALLFILSDSAIAIDKFLHPIPGATWVVMSTYVAAQYLIVMGMIHQFQATTERTTLLA